MDLRCVVIRGQGCFQEPLGRGVSLEREALGDPVMTLGLNEKPAL